MIDPNEIIEWWYFKSSSSDNRYETIRRASGTISCDCPGWTRRVSKDGTRTCKHIREVIAFNGNPPSCSAIYHRVDTNGFPIKAAQPHAKEFNKLVKELESNEPEPEDPYARSMNL